MYKYFPLLCFLFLFSCEQPEKPFNSLSEAQQIIPISRQFGINKDTLKLILLPSIDSGVTFRFIHPEFKTAFWNKELLAQYLIQKYKLTQGSSDLDIVKAVGHFNKQSGIATNFSLVQQINPKAAGIMGMIDHQSLQCDNHRDRVINLASSLTNYLNRSSIEFRLVSMNGHQTFEYFDSGLQKWIYIDPDPITNVFIPRRNGQLVSFEEIKAQPDLLLDPSASVWLTDTLSAAKFAQERYYRFIKDKLSLSDYRKPAISTEDRDIIYRLPPRSKVVFPVLLDSILLYNANIPPDTLSNCYQSFLEKDTLKIEYCLRLLQLEKFLTPKMVIDQYSDNLIQTGPNAFVRRINSDSSYFMVTLAPGKYNHHSLYIPNLLRSVSFPNTKSKIQINGQSFDHNTFIKSYWPASKPPESMNDLKMTDFIYGIESLNIPAEAGAVTLTFYYNQHLLQFWRGLVQLAIFEGGLAFEYDLTPSQ